MTALTWRNVNAPTGGSSSSTGNIAAIRGIGDALDKMNIFKTIQQGTSARYDTAKAEEADAFKRESDLLRRKGIEQDIAKGQFGLDTQQQAFDTAQEAKQAQIAADEQRMATSAFGLRQAQEQAVREGKDRGDLEKAFRQKMALGDEVFDAEDVRAQDQEMLKVLGATPKTAVDLLKLEDALSAPSAAETTSATNVEKLRLEAREDAQKLQEQESKKDIARIKAKKGSGTAGGLGDAEILDTVTSSTTDKFSLSPFSGWDVDEDSKNSAMEYAGKFKKTLGRDYPDVVKQSIKNGHFNQTTFNAAMKRALQNRISR